MARPIRLEEKGGLYHVLNRGNYRTDIFATEGAKQAFLRTLDETCEKTGWVVHAWALMSNHYHLAVETPRANLVDGMRHLQGVFATRFNRLRHENGHIFQGRYKSLVVESGEPLGALCHYIHLNPVRAGICTSSGLADWPWTSIYWLKRARLRPSWWSPVDALLAAGDLRDTAAGRRRYLDYLAWLAEDELARKELKFETMSRGWVIGSKQFKKDLLEDQQEKRGYVRESAAELKMVLEESWSAHVRGLLKRVKRTERDLRSSKKSESWKVGLAVAMKTQTTATNRWLGENLNMGSLYEVSRLTSRWMNQPDRKLARLLKITTNPKA